MDKKHIFVLLFGLIIIALLLVNLTSNDVKFSSSSVTLPEDFVVVNQTNQSLYVSNNKTIFEINEYSNSKTTDDFLSEYYEKHKNDNVKNITQNVDNIVLNGVELLSDKNETININYYYLNNNKTYHICEKGSHNQSALEYLVTHTK